MTRGSENDFVLPGQQDKDNDLQPTLKQVVQENFYAGGGYTQCQIIAHLATTGLTNPDAIFKAQCQDGLWQSYNYEGQIIWGINIILVPSAEPLPDKEPLADKASANKTGFRRFLTAERKAA